MCQIPLFLYIDIGADRKYLVLGLTVRLERW